MFWSRKKDTTPRGIPLNDLLLCLEPTTIKARIEGDVLVAKHENYTTRIEVYSPEPNCIQLDPIKAVVKIKTELPAQIVRGLNLAKPDSVAMLNSFAALGALCYENGNAYIGSRLTIYGAEDAAWKSLHLPFLLFTTILGAEAQLGGLRRALSKEPVRGGRSAWSEDDFAPVVALLSRSSVCTSGGLGVTAEFPLKPGETTAAFGSQSTALFQLIGDQPHPEVGGGLFSLLQLPHNINEENRLIQVCAHLNKSEMEAKDLPPHFGAWCPSNTGNRLAYVSYFGNPFHKIPRVAVNIAIWAQHRAEWASRQLGAIGVPL